MKAQKFPHPATAPDAMSVLSRKFERLSENQWRIAILSMSSLVLVFSFYSFLIGITTVFPNLFYFPVLLLAYRYNKKGVLYSEVLGLAYLAMALFFQHSILTEVVGAVLRFVSFIAVAVVVAFLSSTLEKRKQEYRDLSEFSEGIISNANVWLTVLDHQGIILIWNKAAEEISGYPASEVVGRNSIWKMLYPEKESRQEITRKIAGIIKSDNYFANMETTIRCRDGQEKTISWNTRGFNGHGGAINRYIVIGLDITDRKAAEMALQRSRRELADIIDFLPDATLAIDRNGTVIAWNKAIEEMTGIKAGDMLGKGNYEYALPFYGERRPILIDLVFEPDVEISGKYSGIIRRSGKILIAETSLPRPKGTSRVLWGKASPLFDDNGSVTGAIESIRDITDRKTAEEELKRQLLFLGQLIETIPNPVYFKDSSGIYRGCNRSFEAYLGRKKEEIIGKSVYDLSPAALAEIYYQKDKELFDHPGVQVYESAVQDREGNRKNVIFYKATYNNPDGSVGGLLGVIVDITERTRAEDALRLTNSKLNLLSSVTRHDITNQLSALRAYLELAKGSPGDSAKTVAFLSKGEQAAIAIERQIAFTKEYQNIGVQSPQWQEVSSVIQRAKGSLNFGAIRVTIDCNGVRIYADPLLEKVFYNLMDNAIRYGENITVVAFSCHESGDYLTIVCEDDGPGIPAGEKDNIFNRKYFKHTGFGLFLSREILGITGITISETGEQGKGARFEIRVPKGMYRFS